MAHNFNTIEGTEVFNVNDAVQGSHALTLDDVKNFVGSGGEDKFHSNIVGTAPYDPLLPLTGWVAPTAPIAGNTVEVKFTDGTVANYTFDGSVWVLDFDTPIYNLKTCGGADLAKDAEVHHVVNLVRATGYGVVKLDNVDCLGNNDMYYDSTLKSYTGHKVEGTNNATGNLSAIVAGYQGVNSGDYSFMGTSFQGNQTGFLSFHGAGTRNIVSGVLAATVNGFETENTGTYGFIGNGDKNENSGIYGSVLNGSLNVQSGQAGVIVGGESNTQSGVQGIIGAGTNNTQSGALGFIGGGTTNNQSGGWGTIIGGAQNTQSADYGTISGGFSSTNSGQYGVISGGNSNNNTAVNSTISGGSNNSILGGILNGNNVIAGGQQNSITGSRSSILGGANNIINGDIIFVAGSENTVSSYASVTFGKNSITFGGNSTAWVSTDLVEALANGTDALGVKSNARTVLKNGFHQINAGIQFPKTIADVTPLAALHVETRDFTGNASSGALLAPMTIAERNTIPVGNLVDGLEIYCTDDTALDSTVGVKQVYQASTALWRKLW